MEKYRKKKNILKVIILAMFVITAFVTVQFDYGTMELAINALFLAAMALMIRYGIRNGLNDIQDETSQIDQLIRGAEAVERNMTEDPKEAEAMILGLGDVIDNQEVKECYEAYCKAYTKEDRIACNISDYLNFDQLTERLSLRFCQILPGIMTAMGILGTFLGLAIGLTNFDFSSSGSLGNSIQTFVSGINIAFYTSIYGIVLSIYMNSFYNDMEERLEEKLTKLEKCFGRLGMDRSEQSMWIRLYEEEKQQTKTLHQLNKEFAENLSDTLGERLSKSFNVTNSNIQNLMGQIHERENDAMEQMVGNFLKNLNHSIESDYASITMAVSNLEKNFHSLSDSVGYLSEWQKEMTSEIREFVAKVSESNRRMEEISVQNMEQLKRFNDTLQGFSSAMEHTSGNLNGFYQKEERFHGQLQDIVGKQDEIAGKLSGYQEASRNQLEQMQILLKELRREQEEKEQKEVDLKALQAAVNGLEEKADGFFHQIDEWKKEERTEDPKEVEKLFLSLQEDMDRMQRDLLDAIEDTTFHGKIKKVKYIGNLFNKQKEKEA